MIRSAGARVLAVAARLRAVLRGRSRKLLASAAVALAAGWIVAYAVAYAVPLPARLTEAPSTVISFADGSPAYVFLSPDDRYRMQASLAAAGSDAGAEAVDPDYVAALLRFEDKRFWWHPGVDPIAIVRSTIANLRAGRVVTGASTITMQLVRVLEPRPRTLRSKLIEALRAAQLELRLSKREILAAYLTFVPYGRNVEGVRAASHAYFGHGPRELSPDEIAVLLAVPQRPSSRYPTPANAARLSAARDEIAGWLLARGGLGGDGDARADVAGETGEQAARRVAAEIARQAVPTRIRELPRYAPHAAFWLRAQRPDASEIATTLDRGAQRLAEARMAGAHPGYARLGIHNGAAVVIDHRAAEVRALVGNFDFWDARHGGQIAGFDVARSPGSALKPFLYAMALDRGLALPEFLVADVPVSYGDYAPDNYDGEFTGLIALEEALSHSLNVPFVRLLEQLGVERFIGLLRSAGARHLQPQPGYYGLSAAIGSVEITPLELAGLYAALAERGRYRPVAWLQDAARERGIDLFTPGASYLTRRALSRRDRPDFPSRRRFSGAPPSIHWKTGTSYGHRDAWAAGSGSEYTVVVWLGNFDNRPSVDLVGAEASGPLLFDLLEALADRSAPALPEPWPSNLKTVELCAYSGHLPQAACPRRREALALADRVPTARCPYHVAVDVDLDSGLALSPDCRAGHRWQTRSYVVWPASLRRWMSRGGRYMPGPPSPAAGCQPAAVASAVTAARRRVPPRILSPPAGQVLVLAAGVPASDQEVPLEAETSGHAERLSWFVDGEFLGTRDAEEPLWWTPTPGSHEILVTDDSGASSRRRLEVRGGNSVRLGQASGG